MKTNDRYRPTGKPDKTGELLATVRWQTGQRIKMDPATEFDVIGTADEIGKEVGRRLGHRDYNGKRFKGKIDIAWRLAPTEE